MKPEVLGFATRAILAGRNAARQATPAVTPLVSTSLFTFEDTEDLLRFYQADEGYLYLRYGGPNQDVVAAKLASLEGAEAGLLFASGMAAITTTLLALLEPGDHVIAAHQLYPGTHNFLAHVAPKLQVEVTRVQADSLSQAEQSLKPYTKVLFWESPTNPSLYLADLAALAELAHSVGALLVVDNTFATPYNQRPLELGADLVVHSATKYLAGHSALLAGACVGKADLLEPIAKFARTLGGTLGSFETWLLELGLKTLHVRMDRHNANAQKVAEFLSAHPKVEYVHYPGLSSDPQHKLARQQMTGYSGMVSFAVKGGPEAATRVVDAARVITRGASLGAVESLINQPAITLGFSLSEAERRLLAIPPNLIRLSVGLEEVEDLLADLDQALQQA